MVPSGIERRPGCRSTRAVSLAAVSTWAAERPLAQPRAQSAGHCFWKIRWCVTLALDLSCNVLPPPLPKQAAQCHVWFSLRSKWPRLEGPGRRLLLPQCLELPFQLVLAPALFLQRLQCVLQPPRRRRPLRHPRLPLPLQLRSLLRAPLPVNRLPSPRGTPTFSQDCSVGQGEFLMHTCR